MSERDIHFQNAAHLLTTEVYHRFGHFIGSEHADEDEKVEQGLRLLFAQFAYDLIEHASECIDARQMEEGMCLTPQYMIQSVPDLTAW